MWVLYATVAGTVTVGMDYVAKSGELKFGPGLKVRAEQIAIMDDAIDEGEETFRFRLPNAGLARTGRGPAVGTTTRCSRRGSHASGARWGTT